MAKLGWWTGWLVVSAVACGGLADNESADEPAVENEGGRGNEAGEPDALAGEGGSAIAVAGTGGSGGGHAGAGGKDSGECSGRPKSVAEYCRVNGCPETPDDVDLGFCNGGMEYPRVTRGMSSCGVSVSLDSKWEGLTYHFDPDGKLVGVAWSSDFLDDCRDSVGLDCTLLGSQPALCGDLERCEATDLQSLCDDPDTCAAFDTPQTLLPRLCGDGAEVQRFTSSCSGSVFRHHSGGTTHEWSFDEQGELLGVVITSDTAVQCRDDGYSKVAVYGRPCDATGEGDEQCGAGGQNGSSGARGVAGSRF